jgi:hypothetical protein
MVTPDDNNIIAFNNGNSKRFTACINRCVQGLIYKSIEKSSSSPSSYVRHIHIYIFAIIEPQRAVNY